jgi:hypothetical protein
MRAALVALVIAMNQQHPYVYLRQHSKRPMLKLHSYLEIEEAIDRIKGLPERVTVRRQKDMQYEQLKCRWYGFKAKAFGSVNIVWEQERGTRGGDVDESGREKMADA